MFLEDIPEKNSLNDQWKDNAENEVYLPHPQKKRHKLLCNFVSQAQ